MNFLEVHPIVGTVDVSDSPKVGFAQVIYFDTFISSLPTFCPKIFIGLQHTQMPPSLLANFRGLGCHDIDLAHPQKVKIYLPFQLK